METHIADTELLRRYAAEKSEEAFAELVRRHLNLVYSVALRQVAGDAHLAADVAQQVFTALARKAGALAERPALSGWLYRSTHFAASDVVRVERRRRAREAEAHTMHELSSSPVSAVEWDRVRPTLDAAIAELDERDRDAVSLRFFNGCSFADIGARLRLTENTARMRVERALDKLHASLARRGVTSTTAALSIALAGQAATTAPVGIAASVTGAALAGAAAAVGVSAGGWLTFFTMSKIKVGIVSALIVAGLSSTVIELRANRALSAELNSLRADDENLGKLQRQNRQLAASLQKVAGKSPEADELGRLRTRLALLAARPAGVVDSELLPPRNLGRATPVAAFETFCWAVDRHDLDLIATFFSFSDDTEENRREFMANFSEVVRARYRTPERLCAAVCFNTPDPGVAMQVTKVTEDRTRDQVKLDMWIRTAAGREFAGHDTYVQRPDGWALKPVSLRDPGVVKLALSRLDATTGDVVPPRD
jgi:RNA polymerase sigma factor (sigma-70 family)